MISAPAKPLGLTLLDRIGNTPLLRLEGLIAHPGIQILGKAEWLNPGGSVKNRAASAIVSDATRQGPLTPNSLTGKTLLDATSGNTGIAYAMLGAAMGFPVTLCVPSNVSPERKNILPPYRPPPCPDYPRQRHRRRHPHGAQARRRAPRKILLRRPVRQRQQLA